MKIPKFTKFLPLAIALAMTTSGVYAEGAVGATTEASESTVNAVYQLNLAEFFDIEVTPPAASNVSFTGNYTAAQIDTALVGTYQVVSNTNTKEIYLYATCATSGEGIQPALYGALDDLKLVFTNESDLPDSQSVENLRKGSNSETTNNPNAIAFNMTITSAHEEGPTNAFLASDFDDGKNVHYQIENGKATITCTVNGNAVDSSFSTMDTDGTYKATLFLSDTKLQ